MPRLLVLGLLVWSAAAWAAEPLALSPCDVEGLPAGAARCGTWEVFENRTAASGRKIPLAVVVLPATGAERQPDPLVPFAGGPGDGIIKAAGWIAESLQELRQARDIVLVDVRGTGRSAALACPPLSGAGNLQGFLDDFLPVEKVTACRQELAARADLAQYTTANAVDDVAEVLDALGYRVVNLEGGSYGTRAALELVRRHPRRVRTVTLTGLVPTDAHGPLTYARDAQDALDATFVECAEDPACAAAFPDPRADLAAVLARAEREPVTVAVTPPGESAAVPLRMHRRAVAQTLRYMLYVPAAAVEIPAALHAAAGGDFRPLAEMAALFAGNATATADGYFLSITCSEDVPFIREEDIAPAVAGTFLDDFRIRAQQRACAAWDVPPAPREALLPVRSDVPVLLFSGERDPVTPARWGTQVARYLPRSNHVILPDGGHGTEGLKGVGCITELTTRFVATADIGAIDRTCVRSIARSPFRTAYETVAEVALDAEQQAAAIGRYSGGGGLELTVELEDGTLWLTLPGEKTFALLPVSPTRFLLRGLPSGYGVELRGGPPAAELVLRDPSGDLVLARQP